MTARLPGWLLLDLAAVLLSGRCIFGWVRRLDANPTPPTLGVSLAVGCGAWPCCC